MHSFFTDGIVTAQVVVTHNGSPLQLLMTLVGLAVVQLKMLVG